MSKVYYHIIEDAEKNQCLTTDYLVSNKVKEVITNKIHHKMFAKDEHGNVVEDALGNKEVIYVNHDVVNSIASINAYMFDLDKQYNPALINKALNKLKECNLNFGIDFFAIPELKDDEVSANILNSINLNLRSLDTDNWVKTYNTFHVPDSEINKFDFLRNRDIRIVRVNGNDPVNNIDTYEGQNAVIKTGYGKENYLTYFYNHIHNCRFDKIIDQYNVSAGAHIDYVNPAEIDFYDLNGVEKSISIEELIKIGHNAIEKYGDKPLPNRYKALMILLLSKYYEIKDNDYHSLMFFALKYNKQLKDLIIAKELLISLIKDYLNNSYSDSKYTYDNIHKEDAAKTLEKKYFKGYFK